VIRKVLAVLGLCRHPEGTVRKRHADGSYEFVCQVCWKGWKV
jgi:hypothetical protein